MCSSDLFFTVDRDDSSFPIWDTSEIRQAKKICAKCIHTSECAEWGVHHEKHGVWGGLDSTDLRAARMNRNILLQELELSDLKNH